MRTIYNCGNYGNEIALTLRDAKQCTHSGQCDADVKEIMNKPYVKKQLANLDPQKLSKELKEYGAWDEIELSNHEDNLMRWVWISAGDISENR